MERTVRGIFREGFAAYVEGRKVPRHHHRAAWSVMSCRTSALGGHVQRCAHGHVEGVWYNSCHHRWCPQCNGLATERWLAGKRARLLPVAHRHLVFTFPHELLGLWRWNEVVMSDALFAAVLGTVRTLCRDERHVGGEPGMLLAQHTWGRSLSLHPHIHCLVSEGGLDAGDCWRTPRRRSFLPARVVMGLFRGKFTARLRERLVDGSLRVPPGESAQRVGSELNRLSRVAWNVRVGERYGHGVGVATYLARYVRGGPFRNTQLEKATAHEVVYRYRAHRREPGERTVRRERVSGEEFIRRWLAHVPVPGRQTVRWYGLYANRSTARRERAREVLGVPVPGAPPAPLTWQDYLRRLGGNRAALTCSRCGAPIRRAEPLARQRGPPPASRPQGTQRCGIGRCEP